MRTTVLRLVSSWALGLLLCGASCEEDPDVPPPNCNERVGGDAKGTWSIHAEGRRSGCEDPELNGELDIWVSAFLVNGKPVPTTDNTSGDTDHEADAFIERIRRAQYTLELGGEPPRGLSFSGSVNTCQVTFTLAESLGGNESHKYEFDGFVDSGFRIYGDFKGEGPDTCKSRGTFEVEIR